MSIKLASAPVSWGIYEFAGTGVKFPYERVLDEITEVGYKGIELGPYGYLPTDPDVLRQELKRRDLQLLSAFVPVRLADRDAHEDGVQEALKVGRLLAALDATTIVLADDNGSVPELVQEAGQRTGSALSDDEWDVFAEGVNLIAHRVHDETGLSIVFHHHCAGYVETPEETRKLLERADPDLVGLCLDTGHWHFGGGDAVKAVREWGERIRYLHLKDCDPAVLQQVREEGHDYFEAVKMGVFPHLGEGDVNFPTVISSMKAAGYNGWAVVEQDVFVDDLDAPLQSAMKNRRYLRSIGL